MTSYTTTTTIPISIPSPTLGSHYSFFSSLNNGSSVGGHHSSRGASPGGSSASSSWGRPNLFGPTSNNNNLASKGARNEFLGLLSGQRDKDGEKSGRIGEAKDQLGNMSLE
jgi:hypothetical protein